MPQTTSRLLTIFCILTAMTGCENATPQADSFESELAELANIESGSVDAQLVSHSGSAATEPTGGSLQFAMGDQYGFIRTIQQNLTQQTRGARRHSSSTLTMRITLKVEQVEDDRFLLTAAYSDINYSHDIAGERVQFSSTTPPASLPVELLPYRGLVDNEFSFWLGRNNRIDSVNGLAEFLSRCVRYVPALQQQQVLRQLSASSPQDAVASFVDETIGLLPFGADSDALSVGDSWNQDRQINSPLPMFLSSSCSLKDLTHDTATVSISGTIAAPNGAGQFLGGVQLVLRDGRTLGNCQFDRATGLPIQCRIERNLDLDASLSDGTEVRQLKKIVSTIQAETAPMVTTSSPTNSVLQTSGQFQDTNGFQHATHEASAQYPTNSPQQTGFGQ